MLYSTVDEPENFPATLIDIVTKDARQRGLNRSKLSRILIAQFFLASPDGKVFSKKPKNYYILKSVSSVNKTDIRVVYSYKNYYILKIPSLFVGIFIFYHSKNVCHEGEHSHVTRFFGGSKPPQTRRKPRFALERAWLRK